MKTMAPLIVILGPTAVGKTEISISVAEKIGGEIISADSRLFYRGMDIGTAKPSREQLSSVPHHLVDVANPDEEWSLVRFSSAVELILKDIQNRGKIPFLVGGTGQYIMAIVEGWIPPPRIDDESFREDLERFAQERGADALHQRLASVDSESAERIHPSNLRRVIRALEIFEATGVRASQQRVKSPPAYQVLEIGLHLPREVLYQRIDDRIDNMIENGLVEEVQELLRLGYSSELPSMSAIGYKQIAGVLRNKASIQEAVSEMRRLTRQYVRRQANWFKQEDPNIYWFLADESAVDRIIQLVSSFIADDNGEGSPDP